MAGDTRWFDTYPENLALLTFLLHSFFNFVPLVYQRRLDIIVLKLFFYSFVHMVTVVEYQKQIRLDEPD